MNLSSMFSQVIPTMTIAWIVVMFNIFTIVLARKQLRKWLHRIKVLSDPSLSFEKFSWRIWVNKWVESFRLNILAAPNNIRLAIQSAWRGRERGLAIFAGVLLASLVMTTVLGYAVGLNQTFFQASLGNDVFDAKIDFQEDPTGNWEGRTNDSSVWESFCEDIIDREEFSDCGLVFGRQGIRVSGFFDSDFANPQPLNVESINSTNSDWSNVSWDYIEASENGPPINDQRTIRFYGDGIWDGELGKRHADSIIFGDWPSTALDAETNRSIVLPSKIASAASIDIGEKIDSLTFSYVTETYEVRDAVEAFEECNTILDPNYEVERLFCKDTITVTNLTLAAIYEESFGNPTLLFNPLMVTDSVLTDEQKTILMQNDHGYLGVSVDRTQLPTSSTRDATNWLSDLQRNLESTEGFVPVYDSNGNETGTEKSSVPRYFEVSNGSETILISVEYVDLISGSITFLNIFLGIIQVFDYILVIPIVALSFIVLLYGLQLSLEQRRREVAIHRVIGGTQDTLSRMMMIEVLAIGSVAWGLGYLFATGAVEIVLRAVGFLRFTEEGDFSVDPILSILSTISVGMATLAFAYWRGTVTTKRFLNMEIDEGVRKVSNEREPLYVLHWLTFVIGIFAFIESWIQSNGGYGPIGSGGLITNFILNAILLLLGPFFLWIGGALVLSQIGASGPQILNRLFGWSPAISDIRRGLSGSGSSSSVSRLSLILLLTLSIVTLAAVQGHTGTMVDERTTNAQNGADLMVQFDSSLTEEEARNKIMLSINSIGDNDINDISSMTSVARTLTQTKDEGLMLLTWVVFDGHENTLIWDSQAIPGDDINEISETWRLGGYTAGSDARNSLDDPSIGKSLTLVYTTYELNEFGLPVETGTTESKVNYAGRHQWVPGITSIEASSAIIIGESSYRELVGDQVVDSHTSSIWMFELCDENENGCSKALELLSADIKSNSGVISASDWSTAHEDNERNGGLIFGTPGLLSMMFVVAALASISSAFVFLSLVLSQRKRELAILQAIGASPNQVIRLVLFEIMSILLVSMVLGVTLGLAVSESFNGFFSVFGFIFQLFLGQSNPIDRDLVWPWFEIIAVNGLVLIAVIISLLFTTRRALDSDLATVLKGE
ncbi:MAG: hypothetical protein CMA05_05325 [Euryarchaeota archaeon]|nr:hypothetical protein [Euryarchaeota archaeon]